MRIVPKESKIKNTIWKCYSLSNIFVALVLFIIVFLLITKGKIILGICLLLISVFNFIPTSDGLVYEIGKDFIKFIFSNKKYNKNNLDKILTIKNISSDGVISYHDNVVSKVIRIGQKNFGIENQFEQDNDIDFFGGALKQIDLGIEVDLVKIDRPVNFDSFSYELFNKIKDNDLSLKKSEVQKLRGDILKNRIDYIDNLNNVFKKYVSDYYLVVYAKNVEELELSVINIAAEINKAGLDTKILKQRETAVFLKYNYTYEFDEREVNNLKEEELLEWINPKEIVFHSNFLKIDDVEAAIFSIKDYPLKVKNAWGSNVFNIPNTKVVMRIKPVEKYKAIKRIDQSLSEIDTKQALSEKPSENKEANIHKDTLNSLLTSLQAENESLLDVSISITSYNYEKDISYRRKTKNILFAENFKIANLYGQQLDGFISSNTSLDNNLKKYERGINSSTLAAVFPFVRTAIMEEEGIALGKNKNNDYPFILNIWKRGNLYQNSNAMVIGKSGSGKSFFLKNLIINEWSNKTRVIICDPEAEYVYLTKNLKGDVIDIGNASEGCINPFHIYQVLSEDGTKASSIVTFNTHLKVLESFFKIVLDGASNDVIELINNLVVEMYEVKNINSSTNFSKLKPKDYPIFSDLLNLVKEKQTDKLSVIDKRLYKTVELYLQKFVVGRYSDIWNSESTLYTSANPINFNFQSLFVNKNNVVANAQMLLVFRFIEQEIINSRELKNIKTLIVCDEAHLFIDPKYPIALDFFYQMNKRIRKYHGAFIPATQNISDWNGNEELRNKTSTILKNSQYMFLFKLSAPDMKDILDIYKVGDTFNEEEQRMIITSNTGECFFVGSSELKACVKIEANSYIRNLFEKGEVKN